MPKGLQGFQKGIPPWNKGLEKEKLPITIQKNLFQKGNLYGKQFPKGYVSPFTVYKKGKTLEEVYGEKKATDIRKKSSKSWYPKGHISWSKIVAGTGLKKGWNKGMGSGDKTIRRKEMEFGRYALWRTRVFARDNYTCRFCGERGGQLIADHIKMWSLFPELRYEVSNGQTLCKSCHLEKTREELSMYWKNKYHESILFGIRRTISETND